MDGEKRYYYYLEVVEWGDDDLAAKAGREIGREAEEMILKRRLALVLVVVLVCRIVYSSSAL